MNRLVIKYKTTDAQRRAKKKYYEKLKREFPEKIEQFKKNRKIIYKNIYRCNCCSYNNVGKSMFNKHLRTKKHNINSNSYIMERPIIERIPIN